MYALINTKTKKFYRLENGYGNAVEVNTFLEACTFKTIKEAYYQNSLLKEDYRIITIDEANKLNKLY